MKEKELFTTVAEILVAELRNDRRTGRHNLSVVMMAKTGDTRYRFETFGIRYDLSRKSDAIQLDWLAKLVGMENMSFSKEDLTIIKERKKELIGKCLKTIVEKEGNEYEPHAFGYNGADLFYLHNSDGEMMTANEALQRIR